MTRPDPLGVECPKCGARTGKRCLVNPGAYRHLLKWREPHLGRIRAAELLTTSDAARASALADEIEALKRALAAAKGGA